MLKRSWAAGKGVWNCALVNCTPWVGVEDLYGALNLDAAQFSTVSSIVQRYYDQAAQENLFQAIPSDPEADTNRAAALDQFNERARLEIQTDFLRADRIARAGHCAVAGRPPARAVALAFCRKKGEAEA